MNLYFHGDKTFSADIPGDWHQYLLAGASPLFAFFRGGAILLQQMDGLGYHIRYDLSFAAEELTLRFGLSVAALSLLYVLEGSLCLDDGQRLTAGTGCLCCLAAAEHGLQLAGGRCRILQIDVADALRGHSADYAMLQGMYGMMEDPSFSTVSYAVVERMDHRALLLIEALLRSRGTQWEMELMFQATASGLVKLFVGDMERKTAGSGARYGIKKLQAVQAYIEGNLEKQLRMKELAKIYGGSVTMLNKQYRLHFGDNIRHHIHRLKMELALTMLRGSKATVNEVAERTGYNNPNNFTRAFFSYFGMTPTAARDTAENDRT